MNIIHSFHLDFYSMFITLLEKFQTYTNQNWVMFHNAPCSFRSLNFQEQKVLFLFSFSFHCFDHGKAMSNRCIMSFFFSHTQTHRYIPFHVCIKDGDQKKLKIESLYSYVSPQRVKTKSPEVQESSITAIKAGKLQPRYVQSVRGSSRFLDHNRAWRQKSMTEALKKLSQIAEQLNS